MAFHFPDRAACPRHHLDRCFANGVDESVEHVAVTAPARQPRRSFWEGEHRHVRRRTLAWASSTARSTTWCRSPPSGEAKRRGATSWRSARDCPSWFEAIGDEELVLFQVEASNHPL